MTRTHRTHLAMTLAALFLICPGIEAVAALYPCVDCSGGGSSGGSGPVCKACLARCTYEYNNCAANNPGVAGRSLCLSERHACEGNCLTDSPDCD